MIVAGFPDADSLQHAVQALRDRGAPVETRTPIALPEDEDGKSRIPMLILICALIIAAAGFWMQCYATTVGYPLLIGGRPNFFWTSYLVYAFECGVLAATSTAFIGFLAANLIGALVGIALMVAKRAGRTTPVPFGVFLAVGAFLTVLFGGAVHYPPG